jgi:hypothetical protein
MKDNILYTYLHIKKDKGSRDKSQINLYMYNIKIIEVLGGTKRC